MNLLSAPRVFVAVFFTTLAVTALAEAPSGYKLAWADEFNGNALDTTKWSHRGEGARRDAVNVKDAVTVADGSLMITTYTVGGKHFTGMISTRDKFERRFGYYEARIKFEDSPGMWSAFWITSRTMDKLTGDPATAGMEIDIWAPPVTQEK